MGVSRVFANAINFVLVKILNGHSKVKQPNDGSTILKVIKEFSEKDR